MSYDSVVAKFVSTDLKLRCMEIAADIPVSTLAAAISGVRCSEFPNAVIVVGKHQRRVLNHVLGYHATFRPLATNLSGYKGTVGHITYNYTPVVFNSDLPEVLALLSYRFVDGELEIGRTFAFKFKR